MEKYNPCTYLDLARFALVLSVLLSAVVLPAQSSGDFRMMVRRGESWQPLPVDSLGITVEGLGSQVRVTYEMRVFNPYNEVLEGQCLLPMPAGAQVTGFALETDGEMREASVVDARLGRTAYENTVRKQIDPGLLEMLGPDIYKLRVFPLPAMGFRKIRIVTEAALSLSNGELLLPIQITKSTPKIVFNLRWNGPTGLPYLSNGPEIPFRENGAEASCSWKGPSRLWGEQATVHIPYSFTTPKTWVDNKGWAFVEIPVTTKSKSLKSPQKVVLYWDRSASMAGWNRQQAIEDILSWYAATKPATLEVVPFHLRPEAGRVFRSNQPNAVESLRSFLRSIAPDGSADWSALSYTKPGTDQYIIVTDGLAVLQPEAFPAFNAPIYVLSSESAVTGGPLLGLALTSGGEALILGQQVATGLATSRARVLAIMGQKGDTWLPYDLNAGTGLLRFCGKSEENEQLRVRVGFSDDFEEYRLPVFQDNATKLPLDLERIWARAKVNEQLLLPQPDKDLLADLGQRFGLVTPVTSLLVLERLEDYVTYQVEPPAHLKKEYDQLVKAAAETWDLQLLSHLDQTAELFAARISWWETEFKPSPVKKILPDSLTGEDRPRQNRDEAEPVESASADSWGDDGEAAMEALSETQYMLQEAMPASAPAPSMSAFSLEADRYEERSKEGVATNTVEGSISLAEWSSTSSYIPLLENAGEEWMEYYLSYRDEKKASPGFFLDVANWRWSKGDTLSAIRIASNLVEMAPGDHELMRSLARRFQQAGELELALMYFRQVNRLRPEEPQSLRDMALAKAELGQVQAAIHDLYQVVTTQWPDRFPEISVMAAHELNALAGASKANLNLEEVDKRLRADLPTDLRVLLQWDQNDIDMDLWVTDPRGERCLYSHRETAAGGWMSRDFTGGYGPEEFLIKKAIPGTYKVQVNYYGSRRQEMSRPVLVQLRLILDYGKPTQSEQSITRELGQSSETIDIGEFEIK